MNNNYNNNNLNNNYHNNNYNNLNKWKKKIVFKNKI